VFRLMAGDQEVGCSALDHLDSGMAVVTGDFTPAPGYATVASLFRRMADAMEAKEDMAELFAERDALNLRLVGPNDVSVPTDFVMVYDYGNDIDREIHVKLADVGVWKRVRGKGAG
jgi:hypothetical protein